MNYFPFHIGDYAVHTRHLTLMEDLAYRRLIDVYYTRESVLPADIAQVARLIGMREHCAEVEAVLVEFFVLGEAGWSHVRCDAEIAKMSDKQTKAKASAAASVNARSTNAQRTLNERSTVVELPTPTPIEDQETSILPDAPIRPTAESRLLALVAEKPKGPPDCPHAEVLALWAEVLPSLPQHLPSQWRGARADHLRARWRETAVEKRWADAAQGLTFMRRLFAYVGQSPFLTGKASQRDPTKRPFVIELEWLVNPSNWAKTIEGKYHQEQAA